jgi:hypothetical protein
MSYFSIIYSSICASDKWLLIIDGMFANAWDIRDRQRFPELPPYSHSIVPGGFDV